MKNCFCIGSYAGYDLTTEENVLCMKFDGFKEVRKQLTPKQMKMIQDIFSDVKIEPEDDECTTCHGTGWIGGTRIFGNNNAIRGGHGCPDCGNGFIGTGKKTKKEAQKKDIEDDNSTNTASVKLPTSFDEYESKVYPKDKGVIVGVCDGGMLKEHPFHYWYAKGIYDSIVRQLQGEKKVEEKYCSCPVETGPLVIGYKAKCVCHDCGLPVLEETCENCASYDIYKEIVNPRHDLVLSTGAMDICTNCTRFNTKKDNFKRNINLP